MSNLPAVREESPFELGAAMYKSGLFPDVKKAEQAVVKILAGREFGIGPVAAMSGIHIIDGKPSLGANLLAALVKDNPKYDYEVKRRTDEGCELEFFEIRGGKRVSMGPLSFDKIDANRAGLAGRGNWKKYPRDMYFARALTAGVRTFCPDVLRGAPAYTPEELGADDAPEVAAPVSDIPAPATPTPADEPEVTDAVVVPETQQEVKAELAASLVDGKILDQLREMTAKAGWDLEKLSWALIEVGVETLPSPPSKKDIGAAMAALTMDQAMRLFEKLDAEINGGES